MFNVYKIVNSINNKIYVGRTKRTLSDRWAGHMACLRNGDTRQLYCAMRKYGVHNFHIELIEECSSFEDMVAKEAIYCEKYHAYTEGYNMTTAGEVNPMECEKSKQSHDNKMRSKTVREKISKSMKKIRSESDKTILIHKDKIGKRVSKDTLMQYLDNGWELGSNSTGKIRIYRLSDFKETSIWESELDYYLNNGWAIGGKPNRISLQHRKALDSSHYKKVYALSVSGNKSQIFNSLKDACKWWYDELVKNNYKIINRAYKNTYALADLIKKSNKENKYIYDTLWLYIE